MPAPFYAMTVGQLRKILDTLAEDCDRMPVALQLPAEADNAFIGYLDTRDWMVQQDRLFIAVQCPKEA